MLPHYVSSLPQASISSWYSQAAFWVPQELEFILPHTDFTYKLQPPFCRSKGTEVGQFSWSGRTEVPKKEVRYKAGRLLREKPTALRGG